MKIVPSAYKFRFYPTLEQRQILARTFGCARYVYNHMLRLRIDAWQSECRSIGYNETSALLTTLKKDESHLWLNEISSVVLQQSLRHQQSAYANFFQKRAGRPKFKNKYAPQSAHYAGTAFALNAESRTLKLAKMPGLWIFAGLVYCRLQ